MYVYIIVRYIYKMLRGQGARRERERERERSLYNHHYVITNTVLQFTLITIP